MMLHFFPRFVATALEEEAGAAVAATAAAYILFQRLLMPDSPTMTPDQGRAPLATSRKTDFPSTTQEAP